jgi:hypothetical protein
MPRSNIEPLGQFIEPEKQVSKAFKFGPPYLQYYHSVNKLTVLFFSLRFLSITFFQSVFFFYKKKNPLWISLIIIFCSPEKREWHSFSLFLFKKFNSSPCFLFCTFSSFLVISFLFLFCCLYENDSLVLCTFQFNISWKKDRKEIKVNSSIETRGNFHKIKWRRQLVKRLCSEITYLTYKL